MDWTGLEGICGGEAGTGSSSDGGPASIDNFGDSTGAGDVGVEETSVADWTGIGLAGI